MNNQAIDAKHFRKFNPVALGIGSYLNLSLRLKDVLCGR